MPTILIATQAELDALPASFPELTYIDIVSDAGVEIVVAKSYGSATVTACGSATVRACGSATVTARGPATVTAYDSATVRAYGSATVTAYGSATVTACDSATVRACDSATVTAYGSATVTAYDSATVRAYDSATVRAYGSATVTAYDSGASIALLGFAVGVLFAKARVTKRGKNTALVRQTPRPAKTFSEWAELNHTAARRGKLTVFKRVSYDFKTREGTCNETVWRPGDTLEHPAWAPTEQECGGGKYHACAAPFFCDSYRSRAGDRYVAIEVATRDTYVWPDARHPHKIAFRKGRVLYECDVMGKKIQ